MTVRIVQGHVMDMLRRIDDESVHCVVTSPPYYGLRSYGTEPQVWGGDWDHNHDDSEVCRCGRWVGHLGLEPTPELFIQHLVEVFHEVRRVLRKDGTLWLNIGDSYAATSKGSGGSNPQVQGGKRTILEGQNYGSRKFDMGGCKPKDLLMIPAQLALALRADGWWLRSEIVWAKKAPMPESVTDRPTCAHEKVFLLTKSARYYYDSEACKEDAVSDHGSGGTFTNYHKKIIENSPLTGGTGHQEPWNDVGGKRTMRNVWHLGPEPFPGAHFATFVSEIPRRAILAGTSAKGVCPKCGGPWVRQIKKTFRETGKGVAGGQKGFDGQNGWTGVPGGMNDVETIGWLPSCKCYGVVIADEYIAPAAVLDPFLGSGTTALVADQLGRDCIGIELSPQNAAMADRRLRDAAGMFASIAAE